MCGLRLSVYLGLHPIVYAHDICLESAQLRFHPNTMATPSYQKHKAPCRNSMRSGTCRFGTHYRYSHDSSYMYRGLRPPRPLVFTGRRMESVFMDFRASIDTEIAATSLPCEMVCLRKSPHSVDPSGKTLQRRIWRLMSLLWQAMTD